MKKRDRRRWIMPQMKMVQSSKTRTPIEKEVYQPVPHRKISMIWWKKSNNDMKKIKKRTVKQKLMHKLMQKQMNMLKHLINHINRFKNKVSYKISLNAHMSTNKSFSWWWKVIKMGWAKANFILKVKISSTTTCNVSLSSVNSLTQLKLLWSLQMIQWEENLSTQLQR